MSEVFREMSNASPNPEAGQDEDPDLALAKLLQAQERELFMLGGMGSYGDWGRDENGEPEGELRGPGWGRGPRAAGRAQTGGAAGGQAHPGASCPAEGLTDEELARRFEQQERDEQMRRMLALAGVAPGGDGAAPPPEDAGASGAPPTSTEPGGEDADAQVDGMSYEQLLALGDLGGHVSKGAKGDALEGIPVVPYASEAFAAAVHRAGAAGAGDEEQCAVCRMGECAGGSRESARRQEDLGPRRPPILPTHPAEFEAGEGVKVLPCGHFYHDGCADQWLAINRACPVCGKDIDAEGAGAGKPAQSGDAGARAGGDGGA